jgi:hypothetical protein
MATTRVRAHERRNPHGGIEHVKEHTRRVDEGSSISEDNATNFENEEQKEDEDLKDWEPEGKEDQSFEVRRKA